MKKRPLSKALTRAPYNATLRLPYYYALVFIALAGVPSIWLNHWIAIAIYLVFVVFLYVGLRIGAHFDDRFLEALFISTKEIKNNPLKLKKHVGGDPYGF